MRVINPPARHRHEVRWRPKEISKERNRRPVRYWLNYNDPDVELSQEQKSPEGRVDGRWSWRSCRSIPYVYMSSVCHALLQMIRIGAHFLLALINFCHTNF